MQNASGLPVASCMTILWPLIFAQRPLRARISLEFVIHRVTRPKVRAEPQQVGSLVRLRGGVRGREAGGRQLIGERSAVSL